MVDEPACKIHGDSRMYDGGDLVECVACLKLQLGEAVELLQEHVSKVWGGDVRHCSGCEKLHCRTGHFIEKNKATKPVGAPQICMVQTGCLGGSCGKLLPCDDHPPAGNPWAPNLDYPGKPVKKPKCPYNHSDHQVAGFLPVQNCPNCA